MKDPREKQIIAQLLAHAEQLREVYGPAAVTGLSIYETDADLRGLRPEDGPDATAEQQQRMTYAAADALRSAGHRVKLVPLRVAGYIAWLDATGKANTPAHRAQWASTQLQA